MKRSGPEEGRWQAHTRNQHLGASAVHYRENESIVASLLIRVDLYQNERLHSEKIATMRTVITRAAHIYPPSRVGQVAISLQCELAMEIR